MTREEEIPRDVSDAVIEAINAATLDDFLSFATPAAVAASMPEDVALSASTVRRHLAGLVDRAADARAGLVSTALDGLVLATLPGVVSDWEMPSPQDAVRGFFTHLQDVRRHLPGVGADAMLMLTLAASASDSTSADALRALRVAAEHWLCRLLPPTPERAAIARHLVALRISDSVRWHGLRGYGSSPTEKATQDAVTDTTYRLVRIALPDDVADTPAEDLDPGEEMAMMVANRPARRKPRHGQMVVAVCALLGSATLGNYLSFLTPARIVDHLRHRRDRTTVGYHLRDRSSGRDSLSLNTVLAEVQRRVYALVDSAVPLYRPAGFATVEMAAKRRLWLLASASADATVMAADPSDKHRLEQAAIGEAEEFLRFSGVPTNEVESM